MQVSGLNMDEYRKQPEQNPGDPYGEVCDTLHNLLTRKRGYYGCPEEHPLENALGVADFMDVPAWMYQLGRIVEKLKRCQGLSGAIVHERTKLLRETILDIAGHAVVAVAVLDHEEKANES